MSDDIYYMRLALDEARKALTEDEVPVGAVVVDENGEVIACGHNTAEYGKDALEHAEVKVMRDACAKYGQRRLWNCSLYVTLEPCPMCAAAVSMMRIKRLVYGAENPKGGAVQNGVKFFEAKTAHFTPEIVSGLCDEECAGLLKQFFKRKRAEQ